MIPLEIPCDNTLLKCLIDQCGTESLKLSSRRILIKKTEKSNIKISHHIIIKMKHSSDIIPSLFKYYFILNV